MTAVYIVIKYLTFPGTILHAFFEHMCCRWFKILVDDARVIQPTEIIGHVDHELVKRKGPSFDICFIPFLFNLLVGVLTMSYATITIFYMKRLSEAFSWICLYLGVSCLTNLFPQIEDVMMIKENFFNNGKKGIVTKILIAPIYAILWLGARLERWCVTLFTSVAFAFVLPMILGLFLPGLYEFLH